MALEFLLGSQIKPTSASRAVCRGERGTKLGLRKGSLKRDKGKMANANPFFGGFKRPGRCWQHGTSGILRGNPMVIQLVAIYAEKQSIIRMRENNILQFKGLRRHSTLMSQIKQSV